MKPIKKQISLYTKDDTYSSLNDKNISNSSKEYKYCLSSNDRISIDELTYEQFDIFFQSVCDDFIPSLRNRIDSFEFYCKTNENGHFVTLEYNDRLVGIVAFYCNNLKTCEAYINFVAVLSTMRGKGFASCLLEKVDQICKTYKMKCISLHTCNIVAMNLYKKHGYIFIDAVECDGFSRYHMKKELV